LSVGVKHPFEQSVRTIADTNDNLEALLSLTRFKKFKFNLRMSPLPKGVAAFTYPSSKTGQPEQRILKVENEDADHISGYVIEVDTLKPTWEFKTFLKRRARDMQRK